jgi:hypothetical protein
VHYIRHILTISEGKYSKKTDSNRHVNYNLVHFAQRILDLLKTKILKNYNKSKYLKDITNWIHDNLISICEN